MFEEKERHNETNEGSTGQTRSGHEPITVVFNFKKKSDKGQGVRKRHSHALKKAYRDLETLRIENKKLFRDKKRIQKRIERLRNSSSKFPSTVDEDEDNTKCLTPKSRTKTQMKNMGLSPRKEKRIRKKLLFANVLGQDLKETKEKEKKVALSIKIVKKYRCVKAMSLALGVNWRTIKGKGCIKRKKRDAKKKAMKEKVQEFFEREDNATVLPGKKDTIGKTKEQKKVLDDYLHNLHTKFQLEYPETKISRSQFSKMRPKHVLLANFCNRNTCLCSRHQNMALKLRSLASQNVKCMRNPDSFIDSYSNEEIKNSLSDLNSESVNFTEWKKVSESGKLRIKQVQTEMPREEFVDAFMKEVDAFRDHVRRVKIQYAEMKTIRGNLKQGHVMIWMDFAENFTCSALEEIQSAYWNSSMVTLHTAVVYFPNSHGKSHMSVVGVSETLSHNATTVFGMLRMMIPIVKNEYSELDFVHYLTDSPTSQYRNKTIFQCLCDHKEDFGVDASWDYLEAGHGKGPCDGLGAIVKRSADMAIKQAKTIIQDAAEFFKWAVEVHESTVCYFYLSQDEYDRAQIFLQEKTRGVKPVPGTMKVHAVVPMNKNTVAVRSTSCHCQSCDDISTTTCEGWERHFLRAVEAREEVREVDISEERAEGPELNQQHENLVVPEIGVYVAAIYDDNWYVGIVKEVDESEACISFMSSSGKVGDSFKWPTPPDEIWVDLKDILTEIPALVPSGKSKRLYKMVDETVLPAIEDRFRNRKQLMLLIPSPKKILRYITMCELFRYHNIPCTVIFNIDDEVCLLTDI